ncbi:pyridoxal phosphate-dependent aminotransferase [Thiobacter aerophilum]|uniref:Aminotransferase n=1 Tax=Thiobacter aerophilum TaxID=3121275 RepID=A0ABV0EB40_9BURK
MSLPPLTARAQDIQPFHVMDILARARALEAAGRDIVHMEIGEPDFATAFPIIEAGMQALRAGHTHYTPALGLPALREAIADFYSSRYGVEMAAARIIVTPGASGALLLALATLLGRDDELLLADPGYPCNRHFARFLEARARGIALGPASRYQLTAEAVAAHWQAHTRAVLVASPANPTGTLISSEALRGLYGTISERGGALVVDEIYHGLTYGCDAHTAAAVSDEVFVVNSFSKYFGMTGWRLGWLVAPTAFLPALERLAQNLFLAPSTIAQHAALAAFRPDTLAILEERREAFRQRRDFLVPALRELGFSVPVLPDGAFYVYAGCERFSDDSMALAQRLLEEAGVAVTPGVDFGSHQARHHLRFAYTTGMKRLEEGVARLARILR